MGDPAAEDYYKVLGVSRDATEQDISKAYKKAAIRWHPDKNQGDSKAEENFKRVAEAYDCLSNADKRAAYDRFGKAGVNGNGMGAGGASFNSEQAEAIFKSFFGSSDPMEMFLNGGLGGASAGGMGGMPGFACHFGSMDGAGGGAGPRMMFSSMGGMPGGMGGGMGGMPFGPDLFSQMGGMGMGGMPHGGRGGGRTGGRSVRPKRSARFDEIPVGTPVALAGLKSTERNGRTGRVLSYDSERQRYTVQLDDADEQLAVRADNLVQRLAVQITELHSEQERALNGTSGTLLAWDAERGRYHVKLQSGRVAALSANNVVVPADTRCTVTGLESESARQYNGARGKVVKYDPETGRYEVMVTEGKHLQLRRECVRV